MSHGRTGALLREQEGSSLPEAEDREGQGRAGQSQEGLGRAGLDQAQGSGTALLLDGVLGTRPISVAKSHQAAHNMCTFPCVRYTSVFKGVRARWEASIGLNSKALVAVPALHYGLPGAHPV